MLKVKSIGQFKSKKIIDINSARKKIIELKKKNKKIGLCHGGFDLLHAGHIKHFESAKKMCDYLFVSITSDKYVNTRKKRGRPIFPEKLRSYSIASLEFVDFVVISNFISGIEIIKALKPNYYIKGPDYINKGDEEINAEIATIRSVGGQIKYTKDPKLSTTEIIVYIKKFA